MAQWKKVIVSNSNADLNQVIIGNNQLITSSSADTRLSGSFSGSFQGDGSALTGIPTDLHFSGSNGTSSSISLKEQGLLVSSSANNLVVDASGSTLNIDLADRIITQHIEATTISGSVSGSFNGELAADTGYLSGSFAGSGSGAFSGSFEGDGSKLTGLVSTLVFSGSQGTGSVDLLTQQLNITTGSKHQLITSASGTGLTISISDSAEITGSFKGDFNGTHSGSFSGSFEGDGRDLTGVAKLSGSNDFFGDQTITGSLLVSGGLVDFRNVGVSGSIFSGSFIGDGSGLTGVTAEWDGTHVGTGIISGSLIVSGGVVDFTDTPAISGSVFSGSFVGDGSGLTGLVTNLNFSGSNGTSSSIDLKEQGLEFTSNNSNLVVNTSASIIDIDLSDNVKVSGSLLVSGGVVDFTNTPAISGSVFSGSFVGDGSGLTGIASTLFFSGSNGTSSSLNLKEEGLQIQSSDSNLVVNVSSSIADITLSDTLVASGSFSGSFQGDGSGLTGVVTASYAHTASYVKQAVSASYATTASYAQEAVSASYASTASYVNTLTQNVRVEGDILATGNIIAQQYIVSSSVSHITESFSSGSTIFGDTTDDTHQIIGSLIASGAKVDFTDTPAISGSIFSGSFVGDGSGLTGLVSTLVFSGSNGTSSSINLKDEGLFFSSSDKGLVVNASGSTIKVDLADRIATSHIEATTLSGSLSGSFNGELAADTGYLSGSFAGTGSGFFSGSFEGDGSRLTGIASTLFVSSSTGGTGSVNLKEEGLILSGSTNQIEVSFDDTTNTIQYSLATNIIHSGSISGSALITVESGSFQAITTPHLVVNNLTASYALKAETEAINSGVSQHFPATASIWTVTHNLNTLSPLVEIWDDVTNTVLIPAEIKALTENTVQITFDQPTSGYVNVSRAGHVYSASFDNMGTSMQVTPASNTWNITHNLDTDYPIVEVWDNNRQVIEPDTITSVDTNNITITFTEAVEGWVNISRAGHIVTGSSLWTSLSGPANVTASLDINGTLAANGIVDFTASPAISGSTFSGSFVGDGSGLTGIASTLFFTGSNGTSSSLNLKDNGLVVSSSDNNLVIDASGNTLDVTLSNTLSASGSFSGSFEGDGSKLTGLVTLLSFSGSEGTGSVDLKDASLNLTTGSKHQLLVSASGDKVTFSISDTAEISGSFSGSFQGDGSGLTGITAEWDGTHSGSATISGSLLVSGGIVDFTNTPAISGSIFSGSFVGDGSGLTGISSSLFITSSGTNKIFNLSTETLSITGSANEVITSFNTSSNTLQFGLADNVIVSGSLTVGGDFTVNGEVTTVNSTNLLIEDRWALFASGAQSSTDGGIIVQNSGSGAGYALGWDSSANRWAVETNMSDTSGTSSIAPDAYLTTTQFGLDANRPAVSNYGGSGSGAGNIWVSTDTNDVYIYV